MSYFGRCPCCFKILDFTHLDFWAIKCLYCGENVLKDQLDLMNNNTNDMIKEILNMEDDNGSRNKKEN